jgi:hypothetical protein
MKVLQAVFREFHAVLKERGRVREDDLLDHVLAVFAEDFAADGGAWNRESVRRLLREGNYAIGEKD